MQLNLQGSKDRQVCENTLRKLRQDVSIEVAGCVCVFDFNGF